MPGGYANQGNQNNYGGYGQDPSQGQGQGQSMMGSQGQGGQFATHPSAGPGGYNNAPPQGYNQGAGYPPAGSGGGYGDSNMSMHTGNHMNDVFFAAACCIVVGSLVGGFCLFFSLKPVDFLFMTYVMIFGLILAVLDTPWLRTIKAVIDAKMYIGKYIQFVTRVTFRGVTLIFLASALFMTMWDNLKGGFMMFLAVVLCLFPALVGAGSVVIGLLKSSKLDKARRQVEQNIEVLYDQNALTFRGEQGGLTMDEFNKMTNENGSFKFEKLDLKLIFNALVSNPQWRMQVAAGTQSQGGYQNVADEIKLTKQDLRAWVLGGMVFL